MAAKLVDEAKRLEEAGAVVLDFTNSGPVAGPAVVKAVAIPVIGGFGGGPWLDGRVRLAQTALGSSAKWLDSNADTYVNTAKLSARRLHDARRRRARRPPDQGLRPWRARSSTASPRATRSWARDRRSSCTRPAASTRRSRNGRRRASTPSCGSSIICRSTTPASSSTAANAASSGGRVERVTWADYVAQGQGLLDHLGFDKAHLMGGCMGCSPVIAFAVAHPERAMSAVLFWPTGGAALSDFKSSALRRAPRLRERERPRCGGGAGARGTRNRSAATRAAAHGRPCSSTTTPSRRLSRSRTSSATSSSSPAWRAR